MWKGEIVLILFPFTDLTGSKKRPALISLSGSLDVTVSFISTQLHWQEPTDLLVQPNSTNGLNKPSLVKSGKIALPLYCSVFDLHFPFFWIFSPARDLTHVIHKRGQSM
jgi:hypothetical protein